MGRALNEAATTFLRSKGITIGTYITGVADNVCIKDLLNVPDPIFSGSRHRHHLSRTPAGPGKVSDWEAARAALGSK
jgi:hypothetical protein